MATDADTVGLLTGGGLEVVGRLADSSNSALVVVATVGGESLQAVYKPVAGERPLWDFPTGTLSHREVASYELSRVLGWPLVPATIWRDDGPAGPGMIQAWVDTAAVSHLINLCSIDQIPDGWRVVLEGEDGQGNDVAVAHADDPALRQLVLFDVVANNADRKAGHIVVCGDQLQGIDHGLTFNTDYKLRTVLWGFAGEPIGQELIGPLEKLAFEASFADPLTEHLSPEEVHALRRRAASVVKRGTFPGPSAGHPAVPWPLF